jgi:hypothetical protein
MPTLTIDGLSFSFPEGWRVGKYDEWAFYRGHFVRQFDGLKGVDALALAPDGTAYLIEVKDYRHPNTEKPSELAQAIAHKVIATLGALLPARLKAHNAEENALAGAILNCASLRVVAHIEQPRAHRRVVDPADIKQQLRRKLRAVDAHPKIVSMNDMQGLAWHVR